MDIDQSSTELDAATVLGETAQPIQRAKRTYGSKSKPLLPSGDDKDSSDRPSLSAHFQSTSDSVYGSTSMSTGSSRPYDWAERLKEIDRSDDEETQEDAGATEVQNKQKSRFNSSLSSPVSPIRATDTFRTSRQDGELSAQKNQHSTNTSFASGTSAAVSSPASNQSLHTRTRLSRPLPPAHRESFVSDDELSVTSASPSVKHSEKLTEVSREVTPENKQSPTDRRLVASVFQSPVKSFSRATSTNPLKEKKASRFLGDDSDDPDLSNLPEKNERLGKKETEDLDTWMTDGSSEGRKGKGKEDNQAVKSKVKAPTKKELIEAEKETARIRAEKDLDVQEKALFEPLSFAGHWQKRLDRDLKHAGKNNNVLKDILLAPHGVFPASGHKKRELEDPITNFSSSSPKRELKEKNARNELQKKKLLAMQHRSLDAGDDSDLEIVSEAVPKGPAAVLALQMQRKSAGKKSQIGFKDKKRPQKLGPDGLPIEMTKEEWNRVLRQKATVQSMAVMEYKAADFQKRGGVITKRLQATEITSTVKFELMMKGVTAAEEMNDAEADTEDEEEDSSYDPQKEDQGTQRATSPSKRKPIVLVADSSMFSEDAHAMDALAEEDEMALSESQAPTSVHSDGSEQDDDDEPAKAFTRHRRSVVVSDEESLEESDGENFPPLTGSALTQSTKDFGFDLLPALTQTPFDSAAPRTPLSELRLSETKVSRGFLSSLPISPTEQFSPSQRKLKISLSDSFEPTPSKDVASLLPAFADGEASPSKSSRRLSSPFGFTQLFNEKDEDKKTEDSRSVTSSVDFKPANFGEINSQLFFTQLSPSQRASPSKKNRASLDKKDPLAGLRKKQDEDFLLTQPGPLGRIELSTQEAKELQRIDQEDADAVFKEGAEERRKRREEAEQDDEPRWINDAGLFTQTKPKEVSWSFSQNMLSQGSLFFPQFGELDAEQLLSQRSPAKSPVRARRLVKRGDMTGNPPAPTFEDSSPEKRNAFEYLMADKKAKKRELPHNEFVQGEAEESDDELVMGFSKRTQGDEDEDAGVDPEEIAKLLNDKAMSKDEIQEEAVLEKHQEQLAEDDAENQKLHEAVIAGQLRHKKRGHDWMDDDSSDDDLRARPSKYKKRKVGGIDQLDQLENNPETKPFVAVYKKDLPGEEGSGPDDEDNEFAHLNKVEDEVDGDADADPDTEVDEEMASDEEDGWENKKAFTHADLQRELREKLDNGENLVDEEELMDADIFVQQHMPSSDGFLDGDYDNVNQVPLARRPIVKVADHNDDKLFFSRRKLATGDEVEKQKLAAWAKQNEKSRDTSVRGTASAAITGHGKPPVRSKSGMVNPSRAGTSDSRKPVRSETASSLNSRMGKNPAAWE